MARPETATTNGQAAAATLRGRAEECARLDDLVSALSEPDADLIRQRLATAEIPSTSRRATRSAELGNAGARYVYVAARDLERARGVLGG